MAPAKRIGIVGTFDVANFGDLLFPLLAEHELGRRLGAIELTRYSHRELSAEAWPYDVRSVARLADELPELDLVIVGGGDLVRFDEAVAPGYGSTSADVHHPTGYWLMPTLLAAGEHVPVAWNAVGVVSPIPDWARPLLTLAASSADYVAVRDEASLAELARATGSTLARVVPDTAFGIAALLEQADSLAAEFLATAGVERPFLVVQPSRHFEPHRDAVREAVDAAAATGLAVLELPISPIFGESPETLQLGDAVTRPPEWPHPLVLAATIAAAEAVVAHSLHLSIAALATGTPVFRRPPAPGSKYEHLQTFDRVHYWETAADLRALVEGNRGYGEGAGPVVAEQLAQLRPHWDAIAGLAHTTRAPDRRLRAHVIALAAAGAQSSGRAEQELVATSVSLDELQAQVADLARRRDEDAAALRTHEADLAGLQSQLADARVSEDELAALRSQYEADLARLQSQLAAERAVRAGLEEHLALVFSTKSWRLLAPLRAAYRSLRRGRTDPVGAGEHDAPAAAFPAVDDCDPAQLAARPLVSVVMPTFDTPPQLLRRAITSVRMQSYDHWELCICDDGSTSPATRDALTEEAQGDSRVRVVFSDRNEGIAAASNHALDIAAGELVAFLDHDDELAPDALCRCVQAIERSPGADVVYTDQDKIDDRGRALEPFFKPDWSPEYFRAVMYVGHLLVVRRDLVKDVGGFDSRFDGIQDYELMLRVSERTDRIVHVPRILYHWRATAGSIASAHDAKQGVPELQAAAVNEHLQRCGVRASASPHPRVPHRVEIGFEPPAEWPRVSVVIPTKDAPEHIGACLESVFTQTTYPSLEVVVVDTGTTDPRAQEIFERYPIELVRLDGPFNFARACNEGVAHASGRHVVLLNNDTQVVTPAWLESLVPLVELPGVGAVGPLLVYPDSSVQHAGVVLGMRGTADHIMRGFPADADGYAGSLSSTREVSAVTAACLAISRQLYEEVGGMSEWYATHYQDVDLCLRLRDRGLRILFTPRARLVHHESASRGNSYDPLDRELLLDVWGETIGRGDPYYNPNLQLAEGFSYAPRETAAAA